MAASALWYYWLHRMAADCASGNIIKFDFSFNLSEKERDHTQCSETQTKGQEMGVAFRHSSGCENVGDNIEARKRELGAFNYFCKSERHKGGAAIWPQTWPSPFCRNRFPTAIFQNSKTARQRNLCKATRRHYTCHSTHLLPSFYSTCRGGVLQWRSFFKRLLFSCRHDRTDDRAAVDSLNALVTHHLSPINPMRSSVTFKQSHPTTCFSHHVCDIIHTTFE